MKAPIRMVCGDCLRSVEFPLDGTDTQPSPLSTCPYCGGTIDGRLSEMGTESGDPEGVAMGAISGLSRQWTETWVRGSLGTFHRFQLRELLGDGGFGQVYQAYDPRLDRDLALKVLRQIDPGERVMERFFREARAAARLEHPNIVPVYDAGCHEGRCWIAYKFVAGRTLLRQHDHQRFGLPAIVRIIRDLADALDHAHRQGIYHRDLKPANIIIDGKGRPHLTDFGLARRADLDSDLTRDGAVLGTPVYMSPEQASGRSHQADDRSDVYSLGVIFFELLCGERPTDLPSRAPVWSARPTTPPPPLRSIDRSIPRAIDRICRKALAIDPGERYPGAPALRDELDEWLRGRQGPIRPSHPLACVLAGVAAGLLLAFGSRGILPPTGVAAPPAPVAAPLRPPSAPTPAPRPDTPAPEGPSREDDAGAKRLATAPEPVKVAATAPTGKPPVGKPAPPRKRYIGNKNPSSKILHTQDCSSLDQMNSANWVEFDSVEEAQAQGFLRPCVRCHPFKNLPRQGSGGEDAVYD